MYCDVFMRLISLKGRAAIPIAVVVAVEFLSAVCLSPEAKADSLESRREIKSELQMLTERVRQNSNDTNALTQIIHALSANSFFERVYAATSLQSLGPKAKFAVPALTNALSDSQQAVRREAALALAAMGTDAKAALPQLIKSLKEDNDDVAWFSARAIGNLRSEAKPAIHDLIVALDVYHKSPLTGLISSPQLAFEAADALAKLGTDGSDAVPALKAHFQIGSPEHDIHLAHAIRHIDPNDDESLKMLKSLSRNERPEIQREALSALADLTESEGVNR
jgi:HEAT repeat protein